MSRVFAIVAAAGGGTRFGAGVAKQYAALDGKPMLEWSIERLRASIPLARLVVAIAPEDRDYEANLAQWPEVEALRCGGATRGASVKNALVHLAPLCAADDWILVHDAARPCVPREALSRLLRGLADDPVGGLLAIPVTDTLKRGDDDPTAPRVTGTQDRQGLWQAQTPQMFRYSILSAALASPKSSDATDEAGAVEALAADGKCGRPQLILGSAENVKVTYANDLKLAAAILKAQLERERSR